MIQPEPTNAQMAISTMKLKISSLNINGINNPDKRNKMRKFLIDKPQIILLQEIHQPSQHNWKQFSENLGYLFHNAFQFSDRKTNNNRDENKYTGVSIGISNKLLGITVDHSLTMIDPNNRFIRIVIFNSLLQKRIQIINIYSPTNNNLAEQRDFYQRLHDIIDPTIENIIVGGDFNINVQNQNQISELSNLISQYDLDYTPPSTEIQNNYTFKRGETETHIDYILTSRSLTPSITKHKINTKHIFSDHMLITTTIDTHIQTPNSTFNWCLNNSLLENPATKQSIRKWLKKNSTFIDDHKTDSQTKIQQYEMFKHQLQIKIRRIGRKQAHIRRLTYSKAIIKADIVKNILDTEMLTTEERDELELYLHALNELINDYQLYLSNGASVRAHSQQMYKNEPSSSYFYQQCKQKRNKIYISHLKDSQGTIQTDPNINMQTTNTFWKDIYTPAPINSEATNILLNSIRNTLEPRLANEHNTTITEEETNTIINRLPSNKSPGIDGITYELYKTYSDIFAPLLTKLFHTIFEAETLPDSMTLSLIKLLPKQPNSIECKDYRPISLLCTDYKILTSILATRLNQLTPICIGPFQYGFMPNKSTEPAILNIQHIIRQSHREKQLRYIILLDQQKAFDRINQHYMQQVLEKFNIPKKLRKWVSLIYHHAFSTISFNNKNLPTIPIKCGVRQGCSLSPILYAFCIEPLQILLNQSPDIEGFQLPNGEKIKSQHYADDTAGISNNQQDVVNTMKIVDIYCEGSGSTINISKSKLFPITVTDLPPDHPTTIAGLNVMNPTDKFEYLGAMICNQADSTTTDWSAMVDKCKHFKNLMKLRQVDMRSRCTLAKSFLIPTFFYQTKFNAIPENTAKYLQSTINQMIYNSPKGKMNINKAITSTQYGGINLPHIPTTLTTQNINTLQKLCEQSTRFPYQQLAEEEIKLISPNWKQYLAKQPRKLQKLIKENNDTSINYWKNILISYIKAKKFRNTPNDLIIPTYLNNSTNTTDNTHNHSHTTNLEPNHPTQNTTNNTTTRKKKNQHKEIYKALTQPKNQSFQHSDQWTNLNITNWTKLPIFKTDPILQRRLTDIRIKILHNTYACGKRLFFLEDEEITLCPHCKITNTTKHLFQECPLTSQLYKAVQTSLQQASNITTQITTSTKLFGTTISNTDDRLTDLATSNMQLTINDQLIGNRNKPSEQPYTLHHILRRWIAYHRRTLSILIKRENDKTIEQPHPRNQINPTFLQHYRYFQKLNPTTLIQQLNQSTPDSTDTHQPPPPQEARTSPSTLITRNHINSLIQLHTNNPTNTQATNNNQQNFETTTEPNADQQEQRKPSEGQPPHKRQCRNQTPTTTTTITTSLPKEPTETPVHLNDQQITRRNTTNNYKNWQKPVPKKAKKKNCSQPTASTNHENIPTKPSKATPTSQNIPQQSISTSETEPKPPTNNQADNNSTQARPQQTKKIHLIVHEPTKTIKRIKLTIPKKDQENEEKNRNNSHQRPLTSTDTTAPDTALR